MHTAHQSRRERRDSKHLIFYQNLYLSYVCRREERREAGWICYRLRCCLCVYIATTFASERKIYFFQLFAQNSMCVCLIKWQQHWRKAVYQELLPFVIANGGEIYQFFLAPSIGRTQWQWQFFQIMLPHISSYICHELKWKWDERMFCENWKNKSFCDRNSFGKLSVHLGRAREVKLRLTVVLDLKWLVCERRRGGFGEGKNWIVGEFFGKKGATVNTNTSSYQASNHNSLITNSLVQFKSFICSQQNSFITKRHINVQFTY